MLATAPCTAADYIFKQLEANSRLSNTQVNAIYKDSEGYMWFGTASGLNRYDGYQVRQMRSNSADSCSLHDNYVQRIDEDADGNLWIYAGERYGIYLRSEDRFVRDVDTLLARHGLNQQATRIAVADDDRWIACRDGKLYYYNEKDTASAVAVDAPFFGSSECTITGFDFDATGDLVAVTDSGRILVVDRRRKVVRESTAPLLAEPAVVSVFVDSRSVAWVYGVFGCRSYDLLHRHYVDIADDATSHSMVKAVAEDNSGSIWIGLDNNGLKIISPQGRTAHLRADPADSRRLQNNTVNALLADDDGTMWVGTQKKGVAKYNPSELRFGFEAFPDVNCTATVGDGTIWLGTDNSGLYSWQPATHSKASHHDRADGGWQHPIVSLLADSDGTVWVGTFGGGLRRYRNGSFDHILTADGLANNNVWALAHAADGKLWIGTLGSGIQLFDPAQRSFVSFNSRNSGLCIDYVTCFSQPIGNVMYAGTDRGVAEIDLLTHNISMMEGNRSHTQPLPNLNVNHLYVDSRGLLWIATREGLYVYNRTTDEIASVDGCNLRSRFVLGVTEDRQNTMWIAVDHNLINLTLLADSAGLDFDYKVYDSRDGLQGSDFNQRSICTLPDGDILVGGLDGVNYIAPDKILYNTRKPKLIFSTLYVANEPVEVGKERDGNTILTAPLNLSTRIVLLHSQGNISIDLATDNHIKPERTTYCYRLRGLSDQWTTMPQEHHSLTFSNLPAGNYTLEAYAVNSDGLATSDLRSLSITVEPTIWGTTAAKVAYALLGLLLAAAVLLLVLGYQRRKYQKRQQELVAQKQEELNNLKFRFFTSISHELRTPISLILSPLETMMKEEMPPATDRRVKMMYANARRLLILVNQILDFRKNEMSELTYNPSYGDIVSFVRNHCDSFSEISEKKAMHLTFFSSVERLDMVFDEDKMGKVVVNLLSNAFKYTPDGGRVDVAIECSASMLTLRVSDTGCGIPDADKPHIFERFYQTNSHDHAITGTGIGLNLVNEYVKLHKGSVEVHDNVDRGSVFIVSIPIVAGTAQCAALPPVAPPEPTGVSAAAEPSQPADANKPCIMVVDDNHDLIATLTDVLEARFNVVAAYDGVDALEKLAHVHPDVIVSDIMMPNMDGIELCRRLKASPDYAPIPLLMLTAKQDTHAVVEGLTIGADDYVTKPFNNEVLTLRIERLVRLRRGGMRRLLIAPEPEQIKITSLDEKFIGKAVKYVEQRMSDSDLSVEELAKNMGMSRVHLYKRITALTGKTPIEFIRVLRLKRATQLLRESQLNVSEIAYQVGFNNPKYFTKYFHEEFGMLPSAYQEAYGR